MLTMRPLFFTLIALGFFMLLLLDSSEGSRHLMTAEEQAQVVAGNPACGYCQNGGELGSDCNKPDVNCDSGNVYCEQVQDPGVYCASQVFFDNPSRCKSDEDQGQCCRHSSTSNVQCWHKIACACTSSGGWRCNNTGGDDGNYEVGQCEPYSCIGCPIGGGGGPGKGGVGGGPGPP